MDSFSVSFPHFLLWKILRFHMFHFHHGFETCALLPLLLWSDFVFFFRGPAINLVAPWDCSPNISTLSGRCQRVHQPSKRWSKHLSRLFWRDWGPSRNNRSCVTSIFWMNTRVFTTRSHNSVDFLKRVINIDSRWWFQIFFIFIPILGKWSNLTNIFQMGWNHQLVIFDMWLDIYWGHYLKTNVNEWSRERSSFKKGLGPSKYINLYKVFFWGWLLRLPSGVKRQHFPFEGMVRESIPSSPDSQVLDIQSFCQHLPKVELSYTVEAPLTCGSQVNLRNASVEKIQQMYVKYKTYIYVRYIIHIWYNIYIYSHTNNVYKSFVYALYTIT